jgi:hypothetical protein
MRHPSCSYRPLFSILCFSLLILSSGGLRAQDSGQERSGGTRNNRLVLQLSATEPDTLPREIVVELLPTFLTTPQVTRLHGQLFSVPASYSQFLTRGNSPDLRQVAAFCKWTSVDKPQAHTGGNSLKFGSVDLSSARQADGDFQLDVTRLPLAGSIITLLNQQSEAHPKITKVIKYIQPDF